MKSIRDLPNVKSARGVKVRSAPKSKDAAYMDMFILHTKLARLKMERQHLSKRTERNQQQHAELSDEMQQAKKEIAEMELENGEETPKVKQKNPANKWQTMPLDY